MEEGNLFHFFIIFDILQIGVNMENRYLIDMLKAYFKNENIKCPVDTSEALKAAEEQMLQPYLYVVYQNPEFKKNYIGFSIMQENFLEVQRGLTKLFNQNEIKHLFLKGSVICNLFDDKALRTRGDIDCLIEEKDLDKVTKLLTSLGFEAEAACSHHVGFSKDGIEIEIHYHMIRDIFQNISQYFDKGFALAYQKDEYLYELKEEEHFLFILSHLAKHLYEGAGLRFVIDFYWMLKKWNLDLDYIHKRVEEFNLKIVYNNVLNALYELTGEVLDDYMEKIDIKFYMDYMLKSGVHGFAEDNEHENTFRSAGKQYYLNKVFVWDKTFRKALYPHLGKHAITYPICLIINIIKLIFKVIGRIFCKIFRIKKKNMFIQSGERTELNKKLGIQ